MAIEQTLSIIKPDATARNLTGAINTIIENAGLRIVAQKRVRWTLPQAQKFYKEHKGKPFYDSLCEFMISGPIVVQVLAGAKAVETYRKVMGATDPVEAKRGTLRKRFALSRAKNSVHGSDSPVSAAREINLVFRPTEIVG